MASHDAITTATAAPAAAVPEVAPVFHPTMSEERMTERSNQLKEKIIGLFPCSTIVEQLYLVDTLQHLSVDQHFHEQIDSTLRSTHAGEFNSSSLHDVALRFRILRQQGFWVSPDVFSKFKDEDGAFHVNVTNDPRGLLSLYNAAHLFIHGETELEESISFARRHLESMEGRLEYPLAEQVRRALHLPLPRTLKRVEALHYMSEYKQELMHNSSILEFAKLDFNLLQRLHLKELKALSRWWKNLYREVGLNYSRDRVVECYFWAYTTYYEKEYTHARMILAKIIAIIIMTDDTYDVRATLVECKQLNEAIQRWEENATSLLPEYLQKFYLKLMSTFKEFEDELKPDEKYRVAFSTKAFQISSNNYLQEAEWFHQNHKPRFNDQVKVSSVCSGGPWVCVGLLVGMSDTATKEALEWALGCTDAVRACAEVTRFMNDLASFKRGKNKNDVASSVECYISEHGVASEVAIAKIGSLIEDAWKTTNQARFELPELLLPAVQRVANITISMPFMYDDKTDAFTFSSRLEGTIKRLFVNPIDF
ncbi:tau-cadinol synthase isoform X1 [Triticum aestivum]|uniref:tau-cadinol synthase isoform X1 n=1 Tax=Triticum aestivum TaxID=4565 RepID=UPI001D024050|nr:tau-cadinol synthase-like isoform X1 [Triticum aestivum]